MTSTVNLALEAEPDLAGAYYLRGWTTHLAGGHDADALADFEKAASLDPTDKLFSQTISRVRP